MSPDDPRSHPPPRTVVLVRPWTDGRGGGGCCGGEVRDGVCLDGPLGVEDRAETEPHAHADPVGAAYRLVRERRPDLDVQVVDAGNTAWLLPWAFRQVRRRAGTAAGLRAALLSTTAGAVLVDGRRVGTLEDLGPEGVLAVLNRPAVEGDTTPA